jgi:hypothetical protein
MAFGQLVGIYHSSTQKVCFPFPSSQHAALYAGTHFIHLGRETIQVKHLVQVSVQHCDATRVRTLNLPILSQAQVCSATMPCVAYSVE